MRTIDEAIEEYKGLAKRCADAGDTELALLYMQEAEWLRDARGADKFGRYATQKIRELKEENAELRKLARQYRTFLQVAQPIGHVIGAGCLDLSVEGLEQRARELGVIGREEE